MVLLIKGFLSHYSVSFSLPSLCLDNLSIRDHKCNNRYIRSIFIGRFNPNRIRRHCIFKDINLKEMKEMRLNYLTLPSLPKVKELHFKIMNDIYPSKEFLKSKFDIGENSCQFCEIDIDTTKHIVFDCNHSKRFWSQVYSKMSCFITCANPLEYKQIKFGVLKKDCSQHYLINNLFELAKYFIHKYRFVKTPPSFPYFVNELKAFATSLGTLSNEKAITVANFFNELSKKKKKKTYV